jgi:hypothetical protein
MSCTFAAVLIKRTVRSLGRVESSLSDVIFANTPCSFVYQLEDGQWPLQWSHLHGDGLNCHPFPRPSFSRPPFLHPPFPPSAVELKSGRKMTNVYYFFILFLRSLVPEIFASAATLQNVTNSKEPLPPPPQNLKWLTRRPNYQQRPRFE